MLDIWFFVKLLFLFTILIYIVFSVVVVRQVYLMTSTIKVGFEFSIQALAWAHFFVAIGVFVFALAIL